MSLDPKLLEILVCPVDKTPLEVVEEPEIGRLVAVHVIDRVRSTRVTRIAPRRTVARPAQLGEHRVVRLGEFDSSRPVLVCGDVDVADLPGLLAPGDLLVLNDALVEPVRLRVRRVSGGSVEVSLVDQNGTYWSESHTMGSVRLLEELTEAGTDPGRFRRLLSEYISVLKVPDMPEERQLAGYVATGGNIETLAKLGDVTSVKEEPTDYTKAMTDFASAQAELASENLAAFAEVAKKVQMETVELMLAAGKEVQEETTAAVKKAAAEATSVAKKAAAAK